MQPPVLLQDLLWASARHNPQALAVTQSGPAALQGAQVQHCSYGQLAQNVAQFASGLVGLELQRGDRVGIYLEKRLEAVIASFGTAAAGLCFVPINPLLKPEQVAYILRDCNVRLLLTSPERLTSLAGSLSDCADLDFVALTDAVAVKAFNAEIGGKPVLSWASLQQAGSTTGHRVIDSDMAAILYTSGSTGHPKGVVLSHRNLVAGAQSVASYLENGPNDVLLAALPLSFDAGFSQLTTAFSAGARVVLLNYLLPRDVLKTMERENVTGLTAVPPLYMQLVSQSWPEKINQSLRYFANTGGHMPLETLKQIRRQVPNAKPYLMYGLTEAFRSTYLPPDQVDLRPDSMGKAIPNAEILVLREDGSECAANEPGELVHRGALVAQGYWNDPQKTAERFKPLPAAARHASSSNPTEAKMPSSGLQLPELAVFSGDTVRRDAEGFLYFVARRDDMIKTSGYRVSPLEIEEVLYASALVTECVAFGVPHAQLGQVIQVVASGRHAAEPGSESSQLLALCKARLPAYMVPAGLTWSEQPLPRNANGKLDRGLIAQQRSVQLQKGKAP